jgi:hypothetical protein
MEISSDEEAILQGELLNAKIPQIDLGHAEGRL